MTTPTVDDCRKENCISADQQFSRILRRWRNGPFASFDDEKSNHQVLREAVEFLIGRIVKRSKDLLHHEYWCDGAEFILASHENENYCFGGACIFSDRHANAMWLAPFELLLTYSPIELDIPSSVILRLGHVSDEHPISRRYPTGRTYRLYAIAHSLYGNRPSNDKGWAVNLTLCPYQATEQ